ncbi:MAG: hypothetical protein KA004_07650 [Verrucomicrobiales bacterium]|nr:hypothetical protein [Verrucomicrobiales bacterium]
MNTRTPHAALPLLALLCGVSTASALNIASPLYGGSGICGCNDPATITALGTPRTNSGTTANINDGVLTTRVDTWGIGNPSILSYAGIRWPFLRADSVKTLTFTMACFNDGGWFGLAGLPNPAAPGSALTSGLLLEPIVQVTADGGVTWTAVDATTTYLLPFISASDPAGGADGAFMGGSPNPRTVPFTITLVTPVSGINGIRIIGQNGGASDGNGFLGIFELAVEAGPVVDTDGDGMEDSWESAHGLSVGLNDAAGDAETPPDGLTNINEFLANVDPQDPDSDNDGLLDGPEVLTHQTNPSDTDTDDDGLTDGAEVNTHGTNPRLVDTDSDGLSDNAEINTHGTLPANRDSDGDGFSDGQELLTFSTDPLLPGSRIANIARAGSGLTGVNNAIDADNGTLVAHSGTVTGSTGSNSFNINDGNFATRVDTYQTTASNVMSYVGIRWAAPWPQPVSRLELTLATFVDGGWFGPNNAGPGAGNPLVNPTHLLLPSIQVATNPAGTNWTTIAGTFTSNYIAQMTGHQVGGGSMPNPSSRKTVFTLDSPVSGITAIRLIGREGGTASGGFLGVFELTIQDTTTSNDLDQDGLSNADETSIHFTDPEDDDSDHDGLKDGEEVLTYLTSPLNPDHDGDQFRDGLEVSLAANPASALSFPANLALIGTPIIGLNDAVDSDSGIAYFQAGVPENMNDNDPATRVDTFNGAGLTNFSFAGILWPAPQTVGTVTFTFATFFDGGWFGTNGLDPGAGGALNTAVHLTEEPTVQITTDGGATWTTVPHTSNYLTALDGHNIGGGAFPNPTSRTATFTLTTPAVAVNGVRVIGHEGGTASGGFLGCFELAVTHGTGAAGDNDNDGFPDVWEVAQFGFVHARHPRDDSDRDGSDFLLEYGLGMNRTMSDQPPAGQVEAGYLTMTITKVPGIAYDVLVGSDLAGWSNVDTTVLIDNATTLKVRDNVPFAAGPRRFLKTSVRPGP